MDITTPKMKRMPLQRLLLDSKAKIQEAILTANHLAGNQHSLIPWNGTLRSEVCAGVPAYFGICLKNKKGPCNVIIQKETQSPMTVTWDLVN